MAPRALGLGNTGLGFPEFLGSGPNLIPQTLNRQMLHCWRSSRAAGFRVGLSGFRGVRTRAESYFSECGRLKL